MSDDVALKRCTKCGEEKPATTEFFKKNNSTRIGLCAACKVCESKWHKQYHQRNRERDLAKQKAYREQYPERVKESRKAHYSHPENRERKRAQDRLRLQHLGKEYQRDRTRSYRSRPGVREMRNAQEKVYRRMPEYRARRRSYYHRPGVRERSMEYWRVYGITRRARKRSIPGTHTHEQIQDLLSSQHHRCYYCGNKFAKVKGKYVYHVEHTFPVSRVAGGNIPANDISYLVLACPHCNMSKKDKFPWEFPEGGRLL